MEHVKYANEQQDAPFEAAAAAAFLDERLAGVGFAGTPADPDRGVRKLYSLTARGIIPCLSIGRRRYWFRRSLEEWIARGGCSHAPANSVGPSPRRTK